MDKVTARELELYITNDGDLYRRQHVPIIKNLMTKLGQGRYNRDLAVKLFMYLVDAGAKKYQKDHGSPGSPWHKMFPKAERTHVAQMLRDSFEDDAKDGSYDEYIPKKYKGKVSGKDIGESSEGTDDAALDAAAIEAVLAESGEWDGEGSGPKMDPMIFRAANRMEKFAGSLIIAAKHHDDTQALHDLSMIASHLQLILKKMGWDADAKPVVTLAAKLMKAAKDQGISDR